MGACSWTMRICITKISDRDQAKNHIGLVSPEVLVTRQDEKFFGGPCPQVLENTSRTSFQSKTSIQPSQAERSPHTLLVILYLDKPLIHGQQESAEVRAGFPQLTLGFTSKCKSQILQAQADSFREPLMSQECCSLCIRYLLKTYLRLPNTCPGTSPCRFALDCPDKYSI